MPNCFQRGRSVLHPHRQRLSGRFPHTLTSVRVGDFMSALLGGGRPRTDCPVQRPACPGDAASGPLPGSSWERSPFSRSLQELFTGLGTGAGGRRLQRLFCPPLPLHPRQGGVVVPVGFSTSASFPIQNQEFLYPVHLPSPCSDSLPCFLALLLFFMF